MTAINNDWYIYENDIYGVNCLLEFNSKEQLITYVLGEEFINNRMPNGISEEGKTAIQQLTEQFKTEKLNHIDYATELLDVIIEEDGEIDEIMIEDFERLCTGKSEFGQDTITMFYEQQEIAPITSISPALKQDFKLFFEQAYENWIG